MQNSYSIELNRNETTVLSFNSITDRPRRSTKYCHFLVTSILVKNSSLVLYMKQRVITGIIRSFIHLLQSLMQVLYLY